MLGSITTLLIPLWILLGLLVLLGTFALLGRVQNGRYLRPVIGLITKVPLFRRWLQKASNAAQLRPRDPYGIAFCVDVRGGDIGNMHNLFGLHDEAERITGARTDQLAQKSFSESRGCAVH